MTSNSRTYDFFPLPWLAAESGVFHTTGVGDRPGYPTTHWTLGLSRESLLGAFLYRDREKCSCWGWAAHDRDEDDYGILKEKEGFRWVQGNHIIVKF